MPARLHRGMQIVCRGYRATPEPTVRPTLPATPQEFSTKDSGQKWPKSFVEIVFSADGHWPAKAVLSIRAAMGPARRPPVDAEISSLVPSSITATAY